MGKIKRTRQKFHQSASKVDNTFTTDEKNHIEKEFVGKSPLFKSPEEFAAIPDNLFQGIDINFDNLKKKLIEDDRLSIKSIAKSCKYDSKGKLLTKKEKQKLKHDLFMRKIDTAQQLKREALKKHRNRKGLRKIDSTKQVGILTVNSHLETETSSADFLDNKAEAFYKNNSKPKLKSIKKSKSRQQELLKEVAAFRKILDDPKFVEDPCAAVSNNVKKNIVKELIRRRN